MTEPNPPQWQQDQPEQGRPEQQWPQSQWPQDQPPQGQWQQPQQLQQPPQQYPYNQQWQQRPGYAPGPGYPGPGYPGPGYPNPAYPAPGPGFPAAPGKSAPIVLIVCCVLVVLLAGGGVAVWAAFNAKGGSGGGGGGGGGTGLHVAWSQHAPSTLPDTDETLGTWVSGGTVAVATDSAISAYALADGKPQWTWKPASGNQICALSPSVSGGIGTVASGQDGATCTSLQAVDLGTGKSVWAHAASLVPSGGDTDDEFPAPFVGDGTAYAVDSSLNLDAFDLTTGAARWTSASASKYSGDDCMVDGAAEVGGRVYAGGDCDSGAFVYGFNPSSGKVTSTIALPHSCSDPAELKYTWAAGQDVLVDCSNTDGGETSADFLIVAPSTGKVTPVSLPSKKMDPFDGSSAQAVPFDFAVSGDTLYVETLSGDNDEGTDEVLNTLSLSTGAKQWSKPLARNFNLLGADADGCLGLAYGATSADDGDNVEAMRYAASTGAPSTLGTMDDQNEDYYGVSHQPLVLDGEQVAVVGESVDPSDLFVSVLDGA